ncbi:hypothetical protein ACFE04_027210 [Oxalis oulophora]
MSAGFCLLQLPNYQMDRPTSSSAAVELISNTSSEMMPTDDQCFILYFIMGTYFGPDLKGEETHKSAFQRISESLPPYTSEQLAGSHMTVTEVESVYNYILRSADRTLTLKLPLLERFFHGNLPISVNPQFPQLFSAKLHPLSKLVNEQKIIQNIVFIDNPEVRHMRPDVFERFKKLTRLDHFSLDRESARLYRPVNNGVSSSVERAKAKSNGALSPVKFSHNSKKTRLLNDILRSEDIQVHDSQVGRPAMIFFPSHPTEEELASIAATTKSGVALTGSAAAADVGPTVGRLDIGECEDAYLFRVSLPGVKRDEKDFSCEVDSDGKVSIRGVTTTGEKTVYKFYQKFEMLTQNLCPPGYFSLSFQLPGPVDPQQFSGNFGTNGILEGIVLKRLEQ